jgi:hypothetical protein
MCLPFLNLFVRYDALSCGWCVAYVGDVSLLFVCIFACVMSNDITCSERLCCLVVSVPGYRSIGPGSIPGAARYSEK